jgi:selenoprotein W-related protein
MSTNIPLFLCLWAKNTALEPLRIRFRLAPTFCYGWQRHQALSIGRGLSLLKEENMSRSPRIEIHFCEQCRWLLRAAWYAQELLVTFQGQLGEVALVPGTGGTFQVYCNGTLIWDRSNGKGFPEAKELKQMIRDEIAPEQSLGHSDT